MELTLMMYIALGLVLVITIGIYGLFLWTLFKERKQVKKAKQELNPKLVIKEGQELLDFIDRIIKEKYNYYLYLSFLPIYLDKKIPEKNTVKEIKSKIYAAVVGSMSREVKLEALKYFTEKGIEIYVNEKIMIYMNETDFRAVEKYTEAFREMKPSSMAKLMP
jgi:hypothetical protein